MTGQPLFFLALTSCLWLGCGRPETPPVSAAKVVAANSNPAVEEQGLFHCEIVEPGAGVIVTMSVAIELGGVDARGAAIGASHAPGDRASYRIDLPQPGSNEARVTLLQQDSESGGKLSAWAVAVREGWIRIGEPFHIERTSDSWRWRDDGDPQRTQMAKSLGVTIEAIMSADALRSSFDRKPVDIPDLSVAIPEPVVRRLGLRGDVASAVRRGTGLPVVLMAGAESAKEMHVGSTPSNPDAGMDVTARFEMDAEMIVDEFCRWIEIGVTRESATQLFPGKLPSEIRVLQRATWKFEYEAAPSNAPRSTPVRR